MSILIDPFTSKPFVGCAVVTVPRVRGVSPDVECDKPAVVLIVSTYPVLHAGDVDEDVINAFGVCEEHAAEEVHEMRSSASRDEFVLVPITTNGAAA